MDVESITAQELLDIAEFIYLRIDTSENVTLINRKGCEIFEYEESEMLGKNYFDNFLPKESVKDMKRVFSKSIKNGMTKKTVDVSTIVTKSGKEKIIGWQNSFLKDENGKISGLLSVGIDLTEITRLEEELKESSNMLSSIIKNSPYGFVAFKDDDSIIITNPALREMLGYYEDELKEKTMLGVTHPEDKEMSIKIYEQAVQDQQKTVSYEKRYVKKDGSILHAQVTTWGTYDDEGKLIYNFSSIVDIGERIKFEKEREEQIKKIKLERDKSQSFLDVAKVILLALNEEGEISLINKKGCELLNCNQEELIGLNWFENFVPKRVREEIKAGFNNLLAGKLVSFEYHEYPLQTKDGKERLIAWNNSLLKDNNGNIYGTLSSGTDITEQKQTKIELLKQDQLLKSTFNSSFSLQVILHSDGKLIQANLTALDFAGVKQENVVGEFIWETYWWSHSNVEKEKFRQLVLEAADGNKALNTVTQINVDKEIRHLLSTARPIYDQDNKVKYIIVEGIDVSDLISAEQSIIESEIRLRSIFNHSNDGYLLISLDGLIQEINPRIVDLIGYDEEEIINSSVIKYHTTDYTSLANNKLKEVDEIGFVYYKAQIQRKDGTDFVADINAIKLRILGDEVIFAIVRDITQAETAQEQISTSESLYKALFENTGTGIMLSEVDDTIILTNRRLLEMSGFTEDEVLGSSWWDFVPENEKERLKDLVKNWVTGEEPILTAETLYINKQKEERSILISVGRIPDSTQIITSFHDITLERKLEKIIIASEERMRNLVENVPIAIATMTPDGDMLETNQAYCNLLGYETKEELFHTSKPSDHWINLKDREKLYAILKKKKDITNFEVKIRKKDGTPFWGSISAITYKDISGDMINYQIISDITSQEDIENELRQKLMKYKLEEANLYMVEEEFAYTSKEIFEDMLKIGYEGVIISRAAENTWKEDITRSFCFYRLGEKGKGKIIPPNLETIESVIEELPNRQIILLDRLDYLIQKNGFETTLFFIYRLMDLAFLANHIILVSIDTSTLNAQEKNLLGKELKHIEEKEEHLIPEDLFEVLMTVYQNNVSGGKPTISEIIDELKISRPTARKRIQGLIDEGFVTETAKGRSKVLQVTLKGKSMF